MGSRHRLSSLPLQADKYQENLHFTWSVGRESINKAKFWKIRKCLGLTVSPAKGSQIYCEKNTSQNMSGNNSIRLSSAGNFEYPVNKKAQILSIKKALFMPSHVLKIFESGKLESAENSQKNQTVAPAKKKPALRRTNAPKRRSSSVIFLEEIVTLDDSDIVFSDEEPTETTNRDTTSSDEVDSHDYQMNSEEELEYREYLRLKLKFEGRVKNPTKKKTK